MSVRDHSTVAALPFLAAFIVLSLIAPMARAEGSARHGLETPERTVDVTTAADARRGRTRTCDLFGSWVVVVTHSSDVGPVDIRSWHRTAGRSVRRA